MEDLMGMFGPATGGEELSTEMPPSDPVRKPEANYRVAAGESDPMMQGRACEGCQNFVPPEGCTKVLGQIAPEGVCDLWEQAQTEDLLESGVDEFLFSGDGM